MADPLQSLEHTLVDMGADEFTSGRPHPMIGSRLRRERILAEAQDPNVAILLLDFILGFNASPDPAGELAAAIFEAKTGARKRGGSLSVVASICGTEGEPQGLRKQVKVLKARISPKRERGCSLILRAFLFPPPLRFAEDRKVDIESNIPPMLAAQSAFRSGPLLGFREIFAQLI